ncbi:glutamate synthase subunit beta [Rhodocytophaga rosea]|uniref:Glutamate synthase subunit beta n=1 Tax=Rhodocytophaga rosea TaxID=2704465 RepID=A0A6C0GIS6_9BACT|nr:glutamate synthase subunit beta [Rhodocytophaga rosea]QHT67908.1 glutamate synthase subunit beta [Rhodocytophaga rosea]
MGKPTGFMEFGRETPKSKAPKDRINEYKEIYLEFADDKVKQQSSRCMDCGVPFCHNGCPLGNNIPDFNDAVYAQNWEYAIEILSATNNFPEFTGRICPAPCEGSCVLGINKPPVTIELIEKTIAEKAFEMGLIKATIPDVRTGKKVAVIGSGPAGLAAAAQLNKAGHWVTVFERDDKIGGLLMYGIPDFKLEKWVVDRRVKVMEEEGIVFKTNVNVGVDISGSDLMSQFDSIVLCTGSTVPRDLPIPGRNLKGVHFAMDFLTQQNNRVTGGRRGMWKEDILATEKNVVVIGGGDTGSDCVGTSNRHKATSVTQIELLTQPPSERASDNPWPLWPMILRTSSSHEEGADRNWCMHTKEFIGDEQGNLTGIKVVKIEWQLDKQTGRSSFVELPETEKILPCELALLAIGFLHTQKSGLVQELNLSLDERGNVKCNNYQSSVNKVFAAGDSRRGQSLVVWAISEGREAARAVDTYLMGTSTLESKDDSLINVSRIA